MRLLVTGASGFLGRAVCAMAERRGHDVVRFQRSLRGEDPQVNVIVGTLADPPLLEIAAFEPDAVLHFAWIATPGSYLTSTENATLLRDSQSFLKHCARIGVTHIAAAGTCIEYAATPEPLDERRSVLAATTPYTESKAALSRWMEGSMTQTGGLCTWFRIFYPYGPGEHPKRLPSLVVRALAAGEPIALHTPDSVKDYVYVDDLAEAICLAMEQRLEGPVNIGSGRGVTIREIAERIAQLLSADPTLIRSAEAAAPDPWPVQVADMWRLRELGWRPETGLAQGLAQLVTALGVGENSLQPVSSRS